MSADPLAFALLFAAGVARAGAASPLDPGPSPACPDDMRLVTGTHHDEKTLFCTAPRKDARDTHCFAYAEGIATLEGPETAIRVCMDQYEAPNKKGARPYVMQSYEHAKRWCGARGKRPCTEQEWETACEGPELRPWVYGWTNDESVCVSDRAWRPVDFAKFADPKTAAEESKRLWQGSPSGSRPGCVSAFGVFDMMGNVEEWVTSRSGRRFPGALMGGFWAKPWTGCRGTNDAHEPTFTFYETGFRCCAAPKG
jgi:formylglycine-generating enzyme required for sulfatase activity